MTIRRLSLSIAPWNIAIITFMFIFFVAICDGQKQSNEIETNADFNNYKIMKLDERLEFTCQVDKKFTKLATKLEWLKDGQYLTNTDNIIVEPGQKTSLVIKKAGLEDLNNYTCAGTLNTQPTQPIQRTFIAILAPKVEIIESKAEVGQKFDLICDIKYGYPEPKLSWEINGTSFVESTDRVNLKDYKNIPNSLLNIEDTKLSDSGNYVCKANNLANSTEAALQVDFSGAAEGLSTGGKVGIGIGVTVIVAGVIGLAYVVYKRKTNRGNFVN